MTLTDFLLARIAEDEERMLAECEAKLRIVKAATARAVATHSSTPDDLADLVLVSIALPYADHPDYDERWHR